VAPPDTADGGPDADPQLTRVDAAVDAAESIHADETGGAGKTADGVRPITAVMAPVTRTLQRIRPPKESRRRIMRPVNAVMAPVTRTLQRIRPTRESRRRAMWLRPADAAGVLLARLTLLPAVLMLAWLIPGVPLLLGRSFEPAPMLLISVPLAAVFVVVGLRIVPAGSPRLLPAGRAGEPAWTRWFGLLATVAVVAGLTGWQLIERSQALIVVRDPGAYLQTGYWIAQHGSLPIPQSLASFGGAHPGLQFASTGFLAHGAGIYPAVTPGLPIVLAGAFWVHGVTAATAASAILGGLAVLSFAGLVARLVGPQWAPAGALVLGISMPQQYVSRTTLSETALQITLFGGLCLLADSVGLRAARPAAGWVMLARPADQAAAWWARLVSPERALAALAGLSLGFGAVLSLDELPYLAAVVPFCCALIVGHRPQATTFPVGIFVGVGYGLLGAFVLDRPFFDSVGQSVSLDGVVAVWLIAASVVVIYLARIGWMRRVVPRALAARPLRWLPWAGALVVLTALIGLFVRPYVQRMHGYPSLADYNFITSLQRQQGLPVDPTRTYAEQTLYWLIWYIGLPTVLLGMFGVALVVRRSLGALLTWRDPTSVWRMWALPTAMICVGTAAVLWAPDTVPDQPWASRRLVVIAVPALILCALWAASSLGRRARDRGAKALTAAVAGLFCVAAMLVPTVATTFGLGVSHSGSSGGLRLVTQEGMALQRVGAGQTEAVGSLCAQIARNASVVIVDGPTAAEFAQVVRGMCGVPTAWMSPQPAASVRSAVASIVAAGRQPVLLAASAQQLAAFGGSPEQVLRLTTNGDPHELTQLPTSPQQITYQVWMTVPAARSFGA
jgi:hypothetical protein